MNSVIYQYAARKIQKKNWEQHGRQYGGNCKHKSEGDSFNGDQGQMYSAEYYRKD
jgi:hypothetical protein